ncbi:MAG: branched-chain amino acid ABC transporter permease [Rhodospirillaceae bacterium]|nr:branched-chain amino acid ABC transporter permease [Rhodospirillaceae bacterium]|tara:strand:+ start:12151 stop:13470 length:1320 start_codon:yes stop_codon:yes gene_type:complete
MFKNRPLLIFSAITIALLAVGFGQSWNVSLTILNLCLISSIMALGLNMQWGYAGLPNLGVMGFTALGGLAGVLVSKPPVIEAWTVGGSNLGLAALMLLISVGVIVIIRRLVKNKKIRNLLTVIGIIAGYFVVRMFFNPAVEAIEAVDSSRTGYLGGAGLPIIFSWVIGAILAGAAAWVIGKISLGLRADYFAIATLGISEIIIAILKNEDWLSRGVKNVTGLKRPVPYEIDLQESFWFIDLSSWLGSSAVDISIIFVKISYAIIFVIVLLLLIWISERALNSPWGRMMKAIRDNEDAAAAMGKNVKNRHLQVFIMGAAILGLAGAMLTTLDGQLTPASYSPLRYTFVIWVMVIVGGAGNNWGSVAGAFTIWFLWVEAEPAGLWLMEQITSNLPDENNFRQHLIKGAPHMRVIVMGAILLLVLRFSPRGLIPERTRQQYE